MSCTEEALLFECVGEHLVGVLSLPNEGFADSGTVVLIVVGGPQYRVGSHRQFVLLARALAAAGHAVLRFDRRGMGDSSGPLSSFEALSEDIEAALRALRIRLPDFRKLVLFGLCDGASAALLYLRHPGAMRIDGLCLANPWARSDQTLARTHVKHYYSRRLIDADFWRKLLRGQIGLARVQEFGVALRRTFFRKPDPARRVDRPPFRQAMAEAWRRFQGPILLVLSGEDLTAKEFLEHAGTAGDWHGLLTLPGVSRVDIAAADHTLSTRSAQAAFEQAILSWLALFAAPASVTAGRSA